MGLCRIHRSWISCIRNHHFRRALWITYHEILRGRSGTTCGLYRGCCMRVFQRLWYQLCANCLIHLGAYGKLNYQQWQWLR